MKPSRQQKKSGLVAIIDIGSNSVRMVVFDKKKPIYNEKVQCLLGRDMLRTGILSKKSCNLARRAIGDFCNVAQSMGVQNILPIGTAALRMARNGKAFIKSLNKEFGLSIHIITGQDEAWLSANGVLSTLPKAQGVVADLGGGSLELAHVKKGCVGHTVSLPLGALIVADYGRNLPKVLQERFAEVVPALRLREPLYAAGGTLRALARIHMRIAYADKRPLQGYTMDRNDLMELYTYIRKTPPAVLADRHKVDLTRAKTLAPVTMLLEELVYALWIPKVVISTAGLREGVLRTCYS